MGSLVKIVLWFFTLVLAGFTGFYLADSFKNSPLKIPTSFENVRKYDKYSFANLSSRKFLPGEITFEEIIAQEESYTAHKISFLQDGKKVKAQINIPTNSTLKVDQKIPTILMIRGYAEKEGYKTGDGTRKAAAYFAKQGFLTIAPDFLGFGDSASESEDPLEARFEKYVTILQLLASLENLKQADLTKLSLWAHSNGGHIALAILEITKRNIPTTLWAPVTKSFPASIMVYMDEEEDKGKLLRKIVANFEKDYDVNLYSTDTYLDWINSPIQVQQGSGDLQIRKDWTDKFVKLLKENEKDVSYFVYPGADHNLLGSWNTAVLRDVSFFRSRTKFSSNGIN